MLFRFHRVLSVLLTCGVALLFGADVVADTYRFNESDNAKRAYGKYLVDLNDLRALHKTQVNNAGSRFTLIVDRHLQRYNVALNREVRSLTRAGEIDAAYAVRDLATDSDKWEVTPPDHEGYHFLNGVDLAIEGSKTATDKGVDLLVDVEKAGVLYAKQIAAADEHYVEQAKKIRTALIETIERTLEIEQSAGNLNAADEVSKALKKFKSLPDPQSPGALKRARQSDQKDPSKTSSTSPDDARDESKSTRAEIFEGAHGDEQTTDPRLIRLDKETPWAGYYLLQYRMNGRHGVEFLIKFDAKGGIVLTTSRQSKNNERVNTAIPIEIVSHDPSKVLIKHKADLSDSTHMHEIELRDGVPTRCSVWWSDHAFNCQDEPSQTGRVLRMGNPDADLLGLPDGVYLAKMAQTTSKANKPEHKTIQFEITVDSGHVMVSRHNKSDDEKKWSDWHAFMLLVETKENELVMTYDKDEFDWADLFVIDLSDKDNPVLKHWWRSDWRPRGDDPSAVGKLIWQ